MSMFFFSLIIRINRILFIQAFFVRCLMLTKWSSWSPCSVSCGKGTTIRTRSYTDRMLSKKCSMELSQIKECMVAERCIGEELMSYAEIQSIFDCFNFFI